MKVLVSGAGGFLGRFVVERLLKNGHGVRAIIRPASPQPKWSGHVEVLRADLQSSENLAGAFDGIDAVVHLAAKTAGNEDVQFASAVVATERFLDAMVQSRVKRLLHVSSLVVYDWERVSVVMDEQTPLLRSVYDMGGYAIAKAWQERVVKRAAKTHSLELTILRPGFIWGPQHACIAGMGRCLGRIHLMFGPFSRLPLCHVENCAHCIATAVESPAAVDESFNVIDGDDIRVWRYALEYRQRTGQGKFLLPVPFRLGLAIAYSASFVSRWFFGEKGRLPSFLLPRRFTSQFKPIRFSNHKLRTVLSWTPPLSFDECLKITYGCK